MSKNYFELDAQAKKALEDKHKDKKPAHFVKNAEVAPKEEEVVEEHPLNQD